MFLYCVSLCLPFSTTYSYICLPCKYVCGHTFLRSVIYSLKDQVRANPAGLWTSEVVEFGQVKAWVFSNLSRLKT